LAARALRALVLVSLRAWIDRNREVEVHASPSMNVRLDELATSLLVHGCQMAGY